MIKVGEKVDISIELKVVEKNNVRKVSLKDLLTSPAIVSVYMRNNTSGCDLQNRSLVAGFPEISKAGWNLIAISKDSCGSHKKYAQKLGIPYTLASDPEFRFAHATDSMMTKSMYGRKYQAPARAAYLLDTDGTVLALIPKVNTRDHAGELDGLIAEIN